MTTQNILNAKATETQVQNLYIDAFTIAQHLAAARVPVEVVVDNSQLDHLPVIRTRQGYAGRFVVEFYPTDDGTAWHGFAKGNPLLVVSADENPRLVAQKVASLHWRATA